MSTLPLEHIPAFHAVMRHGSLSAAARALRVAQPTVRRHIEALEAELNTSLFTRAANGLTPTPMAHSLLPFASAVLEQAAALARAASATLGEADGVVRITTSRVVATHVMPAVLAGLHTAAPGLRFELAATDQAENLAQRAADIAIRFTAPRQQALVAQRMGDVELGFFAARGFAPCASIQDAPLITDDRENLILPALVASGMAQPRNVVLRCDDPLAQIAHICAGLGVGICQAKLGTRLGLVRLWPEVAYQMPMWLVVHEGQASVPRIRVAFEHLKATLPDWM